MKDLKFRLIRGLFTHDFDAHPDWPRSILFRDQHALRQIGWMAAFNNPPPLSNPITVAVLDGGVDHSNSDLRGMILPGTSFFSGQSYKEDCGGRGTMAASIIASPVNGGSLISGVALSRALILPVKVVSDKHTIGDLAWGIHWAVDNGARVILIPFSTWYDNRAVETAVRYAWDKGAVIVAAAGDTFGKVGYPARFRCVLGVAGTDAQDRLWKKSSYGDGASISAPAVGVLSVGAHDGLSYNEGTSFAAALVAGAAALLWAYDPDLTNAQLVSRLVRTATPAKGAPGRLNIALAIADRKTDSLIPNQKTRG